MGKEMAPVTVVAFRAESLLTERQELCHPIADQIFLNEDIACLLNV